MRQARYGHLLSLHILFPLHHGYSPTRIAECLFCSRSSIYRSVAVWCSGALTLTVPKRLFRSWWGRVLADDLRRTLVTLLRRVPAAFGWMRTRWSCACLALTLSRQLGYEPSAETVRRWLHQAGYVWKHPSLVTRASLLARIRLHWENLHSQEALVFADSCRRCWLRCNVICGDAPITDNSRQSIASRRWNRHCAGYARKQHDCPKVLWSGLAESPPPRSDCDCRIRNRSPVGTKTAYVSLLAVLPLFCQPLGNALFGCGELSP